METQEKNLLWGKFGGGGVEESVSASRLIINLNGFLRMITVALVKNLDWYLKQELNLRICDIIIRE